MSVIFVELFKLKHQCTRTTANWRPSFSCRCSSPCSRLIEWSAAAARILHHHCLSLAVASSRRLSDYLCTRSISWQRLFCCGWEATP